MFVAVCYDIVEDKKRNSMAKLLLDYGRRVQKSVFECELDEKDLNQMIDEAMEYLDEKEDSLILYHLCEGCQPKIKSYGREIVRKNIMIV